MLHIVNQMTLLNGRSYFFFFFFLKIGCTVCSNSYYFAYSFTYNTILVSINCKIVKNHMFFRLLKTVLTLYGLGCLNWIHCIFLRPVVLVLFSYYYPKLVCLDFLMNNYKFCTNHPLFMLIIFVLHNRQSNKIICGIRVKVDALLM